MPGNPKPEFGKRRPAVPPPPAPPTKRSSHVALLMMGTFAVGGGAYAVMSHQNCQPAQPPGMAAPAVPQPGADCTRSSSSGYGGHGGGYSRSSFFSSSDSSSGGSSSGSESVSRGGFGSFARAFGFHGG
jgi:hypothetical protein